jgi:hypothetical protein
MSRFTEQVHGMIKVTLVGDDSNMPLVKLEVFDNRESTDAVFATQEARRTGYMLLGLASEADTQAAYITALRSRKIPEEEIMRIIGDAADFIRAARMQL